MLKPLSSMWMYGRRCTRGVEDLSQKKVTL